MIRIDHTAMYVRDLEATRQFFVRFFGAVCGEPYHNPRTGLRSCFLRFGDGARLEIMHRPDMTDPRKEPLRSGYIHLAFGIGSREAVDRLTGELRENGYRIVSGPRITGDGCYESCVEGPEENLIEITE
jgi:glyoxalase family protein